MFINPVSVSEFKGAGGGGGFLYTLLFIILFSL